MEGDKERSTKYDGQEIPPIKAENQARNEEGNKKVESRYVNKDGREFKLDDEQANIERGRKGRVRC